MPFVSLAPQLIEKQQVLVAENSESSAISVSHLETRGEGEVGKACVEVGAVTPILLALRPWAESHPRKKNTICYLLFLLGRACNWPWYNCQKAILFRAWSFNLYSGTNPHEGRNAKNGAGVARPPTALSTSVDELSMEKRYPRITPPISHMDRSRVRVSRVVKPVTYAWAGYTQVGIKLHPHSACQIAKLW